MIEFSCPSCGKDYKANDDAAGKAIKCQCGNQFPIQGPEAESEVFQLSKDDIDSVASPMDSFTIADEDTVTSGDDKSVIAPTGDVEGLALGDDPLPTGGPREDGWQPQWSKERFDAAAAVKESTFTIKGLIFTILAVVLVPALLIYSNRCYKTYKAKVAFRKGINAIRETQYREAIGYLDECIGTRPEWDAAYLPAAYAAYRAEMHGEADTRLRELIDMRGVQRYGSYALNDLGAIALLNDKPDYDAAEEQFNQALQKDPGLIPANLGLALICLGRKNTQRAQECLNKLKPQESSFSEEQAELYTRMRMRLSFMQGNRPQFLKDFQAALPPNSDPNLRREANLMALEMVSSQDVIAEGDEALLAMALDANNPEREGEEYVVVQTAIAKLLYRTGQTAKCITELEKIIKPEDPPSDLTHLLANCYAQTAMQEEKEEEKKALVDKTISLYTALSDDEQILKKKGDSLILHAISFCAKVDRKDEAEAFMEKGLGKFPENADLHRMRGALLFEDGDFNKALGHFEESLKLNPDQEALKNKIDGYKADPIFTDFRPSKPGDFVVRPLIHVRIKSGTPFPIDNESIELKLDGTVVTFTMGGNECFYLPDDDLSNGEHSVQITAADVAGNSASQEYKCYVDLGGPTAELLYPERNTTDIKPTVRIKLSDDFSAVAPRSVSIVLKSAPGSKDDISLPAVYEGTYRTNNEDLGYKMGDALTDTDEIVFDVSRPLTAGTYHIDVKMSDELGNSSKAKLEFTVEGGTGE